RAEMLELAAELEHLRAVWLGLRGSRDVRSEERRVGKSVGCCVDLGGRRIIKKKKEENAKGLSRFAGGNFVDNKHDRAGRWADERHAPLVFFFSSRRRHTR